LGGGISRVLYRVAAARIISLGASLPTPSSSLPGTLAGRAAPRPLFGLAPSGVYRATPVTRGAVRSYRTLSPLPVPVRAIGGLLSVALSVASRRPAVSRHSALWSSDFPRGAEAPRDPHSPPKLSSKKCPGEDSNLHAVSGTRSLVWPVYQFQHLGSPANQRCPAFGTTETVLPRGLEPPRACAHWILNPARLPIPPQEHNFTSELLHAPGEIRTPDLLIRSQTLYPAELRARVHQIKTDHGDRSMHREGIEPSTLGLRVPCSAS
jgi:hypothetical protein